MRDNLVEAVIRAPHVIQSQLVEVAGTVVYADFPEAWPGLLEALLGHLTSNVRGWRGGAGFVGGEGGAVYCGVVMMVCLEGRR